MCVISLTYARYSRADFFKSTEGSDHIPRTSCDSLFFPFCAHFSPFVVPIPCRDIPLTGKCLMKVRAKLQNSFQVVVMR